MLFPYHEELGMSVFEETQLQLQDELLRNLRIDGIHDDNGIVIDDDYHTNLYVTGGDDYSRSDLMLKSLSSTSEDDDLCGEFDLFKPPESCIVEEKSSPVTSSSSTRMKSTGEDIIAPVEPTKIMMSDTETLDEEHYLLLDFIDASFLSELPNLESQDSPAVLNDPLISEEDGCLQKTLSADSTEWRKGLPTKPFFFDLREIGVETDGFGIRRAYSEGDIKTLRQVHLGIDQVLAIEYQKMEERKQKLSRYMHKKMKRNFGRKIKYACRKAMADSQPRVRGRFAKP